MMWILSSFLFPVYKLNRENTQPENMFDIAFEMAKDRGGRASVYVEAVV